MRMLLARGIRTMAHVRPDSPRLDDWRSRFSALGADVDATPWTCEAMRDRMRASRPGLVFALLGTTRARAKAGAGSSERPETYDAIDYGLTSLLLRAVIDAGHRPRFVYLSSIGVSERSRNAYIRARWRVESELRASGVPFTIARPSFITGEDRDEDRPAERLLARVANSALTVADVIGASRVRDRYRSMTGDELATALVAAALDPDAENAVLDAADLRALLRDASAPATPAAPP